MVKTVEIAAAKCSVVCSCQTMVYPVPRMNALMRGGISGILAYFCNLVVDSHMVKVTSCLANTMRVAGMGDG